LFSLNYTALLAVIEHALDPWYTPQKKLKGIRYGECCSLEVGPHQLIQWSGNFLFKNVVTLLWICGCALSCWKTSFSLLAVEVSARSAGCWGRCFC
jgi:hypothetical protein